MAMLSVLMLKDDHGSIVSPWRTAATSAGHEIYPALGDTLTPRRDNTTFLLKRYPL